MSNVLIETYNTNGYIRNCTRYIRQVNITWKTDNVKMHLYVPYIKSKYIFLVLLTHCVYNILKYFVYLFKTGKVY